MTNKEINDFLKEVVTWFRKYRDQRPITDKKLLLMIYEELEDIMNRYGRYKKGSYEAANKWIIEMSAGLYRELEQPEGKEEQ